VPMMAKISENAEIFNKYCLESFEALCLDPIPNLRACCAKLVAFACDQRTSVTLFKRMLIKFKRDDDPDVRINAF